jgi:hypothetical protein
MYKGKPTIKGQVNVRLNADEYIKLKALSDADRRSMSNYAAIIIEDYLKGKHLPPKLNARVKIENQTEQTGNKRV